MHALKHMCVSRTTVFHSIDRGGALEALTLEVELHRQPRQASKALRKVNSSAHREQRAAHCLTQRTDAAWWQITDSVAAHRGGCRGGAASASDTCTRRQLAAPRQAQ